MKILMVHPHDLFSPCEPWTIRIVKFAQELAKKGHNVVLAYFVLGNEPGRSIDGVEMLPLGRAISAGTLIANVRILYQYAKLADVVHIQKGHFYAAIPAVLAAYIAGRPVHYDWDDWEEKIFYSSIARMTLTGFLAGLSFCWMERALPFLADSVSVSSRALQALAIQRGADKRHVFLAPVGADIRLFHEHLDGKPVRERYNLGRTILVLYHGQLHSCQYVHLFLQAIKVIVRSGVARDFKFMILGSGSEFESLKRLAVSLEVGDQVIFTGFISHEDVPGYIAAADICVAPFEDNEVTRCKSPLKIAEYLACGKPIVASDVGEVGGMVGAAGLLVAPGHPESMARAVLSLAGDESRRKAMSEAALRQSKDCYNWRRSAEVLEQAYQGACSTSS